MDDRFGFLVRRVLTDNDSCYRDGIFRQMPHQHIKHRLNIPAFRAPLNINNLLTLHKALY